MSRFPRRAGNLRAGTYAMIRKRVCIRAILGFLSVVSLTARAEHKNASPYKVQPAAAQPAQSAAQTAPRDQRAYAMKIDFDRRVKMRDGVELSADVYRPDAPGQFPVILDRTPYVKASGGTRRVDRMRKYVEQGYVFVVMDVRGRGDSDGHFIPYRADGEDGYDAIEWCAAQPWSSGKVGTYGGSYEGMNQWLAAVQQPPHLTTMIALVSPSDQFVEDPTGIPIPQDISWYFFHVRTRPAKRRRCRLDESLRTFAVLDARRSRGPAEPKLEGSLRSSDARCMVGAAALSK